MASFSSMRLPLEIEIAETFVGGCAGTVGGIRGGGEPAFVDAAAVRAESVQVARIELQPAAGHQERTGHPARCQTHETFTCRERLSYQ
jgi:hypothetical protein